MCDKQLYEIKNEILSEMHKIHDEYSEKLGKIEIDLRSLAFEKKIQNSRIDKQESITTGHENRIQLGERERQSLFAKAANNSPFWLAWQERMFWLAIIIILLLGINIENIIRIFFKFF
jgi:hypothetical protein